MVPPGEPKVRPTKVDVMTPVSLSLSILITIMPVTSVFTAIDAVKPVRYNVFGQYLGPLLLLILLEVADTSQVASRGDKLKSAYQMKMESLTDLTV